MEDLWNDLNTCSWGSRLEFTAKTWMLPSRPTTCCPKNGSPMPRLLYLMPPHLDLSCQGIITSFLSEFHLQMYMFLGHFSCFLLTMRDDSIDGIYETLKQCAIISKSAGGIGLNIHCIRATGSYIAGTNGISNGLVPMLRVFNNTARYVDQGGNKVWLLRITKRRLFSCTFYWATFI